MGRPDLDLIRRVSGLLRSCRKAAGYATARAFYDAAGGRARLECDYTTYRRLEAPGRLPKPATFEKIHAELSTCCEPRLLRALARAYAQALLGAEMSQWPSRPVESARAARRPADLPAMPPDLWEKVVADLHLLAGLLALETGRVDAADLPGPLSKARRALDRLVRFGLARRDGDAYAPAPHALPAARTAQSAHDRGRLLSRLAAASDSGGEIVGGVTAFVQSDREDMAEFFRHLWGAASPLVREARARSKREEPVYLLEVVIRERFSL